MNAELRNPILQYGIKLPESDSFLGMPSRKHWILYAQKLDPFSIKNWLGFNLSRGTGEYASKTEFCEVRGVAHSQCWTTACALLHCLVAKPSESGAQAHFVHA